MRTLRKFFLAAMAMVFLASASAFAQQGARRNNTVTSRQETKAASKQEKVNEVQKPANVESQSGTDIRMRSAGGTQSNRRDGTVSSGSSSGSYGSGSSSSAGKSSGSSVKPPVSGGSSSSGGYGSGNSAGRPSEGGYSSGGSASRPPAGSSGSGSTSRPPAGDRPSSGSYGSGGTSRPPAGDRPSSGSYGSGGTSRPPAGGSTPPPAGNRPPAGSGYPGGYDYPGLRPALPAVRNYDSYGIVTRTNASEIVVRTTFRTREDAYDYVARLLEDRYFTIGSYGNGYSWLQTDVTFIPTPFDWTNPMTHNQFRIRASISSSLFGVVRVTLSGEWRESILSSAFSTLRFQPSDRYSTYYAWSILEDIAEKIPGSSIAYR